MSEPGLIADIVPEGVKKVAQWVARPFTLFDRNWARSGQAASEEVTKASKSFPNYFLEEAGKSWKEAKESLATAHFVTGEPGFKPLLRKTGEEVMRFPRYFLGEAQKSGKAAVGFLFGGNSKVSKQAVTLAEETSAVVAPAAAEKAPALFVDIVSGKGGKAPRSKLGFAVSAFAVGAVVAGWVASCLGRDNSADIGR
jgi:hypothetical protein